MKTFNLFLASLLLASSAMAGIAGKWDVTSTTDDGQKIRSVLTVTEAAGKVELNLRFGEQNMPVSNVAFTEGQLAFRLMWGETGVNVKAKLDGDKLDGKWVADSGDTGPVTAVRIPEAAASSNSSLSGKWKLTAARPDREPIKVELEVKETAGKWSGLIITPDGQMVPAQVAVEGTNMTVTVDAGNAVYTLKLAKEGDGMKGTAAGPDGTIPLTATR